MSEVVVKQINLSVNDITVLPGIFIRELTKNINTQIFISNSLYNELVKNIERYLIWTEDVFGGMHYCDAVEKAFLFSKDLGSYDFVMQMNFAEYCNNFKQLTYFEMKGLKYTHYKKDMNNVLIIYTG